MLPLGLIFLAGSAGTAGVLVAAFSVTSALAPARGRIVDRHGARALAAFALACACSAWALVLASVADAPTVALAALSGLVGLLAPPLGPFTRAAYGRTLRDRGELLQRTFGLDSAAEEAAVIFAPLLVAMFAGLLSPEIGLAIAAAALLAGTVATARWTPGHVARATAPGGRIPLPVALWLLYGALALTAAALGAIEISLPAAARELGHFSAAGVLLAGMAVATVAGSLLAGRSPLARPAGMARGRAAGPDGRRSGADGDRDRLARAGWPSRCSFRARRSARCSPRRISLPIGWHPRGRARARSPGWSPPTTAAWRSEPPSRGRSRRGRGRRPDCGSGPAVRWRGCFPRSGRRSCPHGYSERAHVTGVR